LNGTGPRELRPGSRGGRPASGLPGWDRLKGVISFDALLQQQAEPLTRRLTRLLGDRDLAEDALQEALARAWRSAPRDLEPARLQAWLHRTARNAAVDELRRRRRRSELPLHDAAAVATGPDDGERRRAVAAALAALTPHARMLLLLRYEAGLSLAEVGALLDVSEDAARKRVARAKAAFRDALRDAERVDDRPTVVVLMGRDDPEAYRRWLGAAGARTRVVDRDQPGLDLAGADAIVLSGSATDVHPRTYGAPLDPRSVSPDLHRDLRDLAALRAALRDDVPTIGVCRGAQLLTVLFGGDLAQHVEDHDGDRPHAVRTAPGSAIRRALGDSATVVSDHHQAVRRLGRGLRVTATAPDGLPEAIEVPGRRLALGLQWHPERGGGRELAEALVAAAAA
jgi:putative glutamine amidotransferase